MTGYPHNDYIAYHKSLAEIHKDLRHHDRNNISFVRTELDEFQNLLQNGKLHSSVMHLQTLHGRLIDQVSVAHDQVSGGFVLLCRIDGDATSQDNIAAAYDKAKQIGMDIIARIKEDSRTKCPKLLKAFDLGKVRYEMTGFYSGHYCGYAFDYPLTQFQAFEYDATKWLSQ